MTSTTDVPTVPAAPTSGAAARPALARCTAVPAEDFARRVWGRQASLSRATDLPRGFDDLLSLEAADRLMSEQGLRTPFLRVARNGTTLPTSRFTWGGGVGAAITDQVSDVRLAQLFDEGSTIVLQALHRTHGPLIRLAQDLTAELGHPVQVNAYITPPQSQGFSDHYDVHDVFVLQVAGRKRWIIHEPVLHAPLRDQPWTDRRADVEAAAAREPLLDVVLEPGDALYLPRGFLHAATALGGVSAHLTVGVHVWTRRHLAEQLLAMLDGVPELRESLPLGVRLHDPDDAVLAEEFARTLRLVADALPGIDLPAVTAALAAQSRGAARAEPVGPLAQAAAVREVGSATRLRWRGGQQAVVSSGAAGLRVRTQDVDVTLPAEAAGAIEALRGGDVLAVADLAPDAGTALDLARRLLRHALAVPA